MKIPTTKIARSRTAAKSMAALSLVSGLSMATEQSAQASIVYTNSTATVDSNNPSYNLDLNGDSTVDYTLQWNGIVGKIKETISSSPGGGTAASNEVVINGGYAAALDVNTLISSSSSFGSGTQDLGTTLISGTVQGPFATQPGDHYLGLKFDIGGEAHYGWAILNDVVGSVGGEQSLTLKGWAYETIAGKSILAGQTFSSDNAVPEPASLVQLALGAAAVASLTSLRRRKQIALEV